MLINPPKIDRRDFQELLDEAKKLAPFYVPEWDIADDKDSAVALLKIFFHMLQEVTTRLNEVPEKNFIAFLDMLGVKQNTAQPAEVALAFQLATGAPNVQIPESTQAEASATEEREALIFETAKNILATTASLTDIYSVVPAKDKIFDHSQNLNSKDFELFVNQDKQEHVLYMGHENLFNIKGEAKISIKISPFHKKLADEDFVSWQYYGKKVQVIDGEEVETPGWYSFDFEQDNDRITLVKNNIWNLLFSIDESKYQKELNSEEISAKLVNEFEDNGITLSENAIVDVEEEDSKWQITDGESKFFLRTEEKLINVFAGDITEIISYEINDIETRWIRCILGVNTTIADYVSAGASSFLVNSTFGISDGEQLQIADWETTDDDTEKVEFVKVKSISGTKIVIQEPLQYVHNKGILVKKVQNISDDWKKTVNELKIDTIELQTSTKESGIAPDLLFSNDVPLDLSGDIYPFGKFPRLFDTFYIASQDIFSKKGTTVVLDMTIIREQMETPVRRVQGIGEIFASELEEGLVFSADSENLEKDLDEGNISEDLRKEFEDNHFSLSQNVNISVQDEGSKWLINDEDNNKTYIVKKEQGEINVYVEPIKSVEKLLELSPEQLAQILETNVLRATNILEAARKEFHDKTPPVQSTDDENTDNQTKDDELTLSWEYWDGQGWIVIKSLTDSTANLTEEGKVTFLCPEDITTNTVIGQENYWIRVRIVNGDYGKEKFTFDESENTWKSDTSEIEPPVITSLQLSYKQKIAFDLQHCLTHNNLEFNDVTQKSQTQNEQFQPFQLILEEHQTMYLGFNKQLLKGPISLFFYLEEKRYPDENRPRVRWYYSPEEDEWIRLEVLDSTENLTRSGTIELIGSSDFAQTSLFGKQRYWLKAVDIEDRFQRTSEDEIASDKMNQSRQDKEISEVSTIINPCPEESKTFSLDFSTEVSSLAPEVKGIYINATWGNQSVTIQNEILGSSDGTSLQVFQSTQTPLLSEKIEVNEIGSLSEEEKQALIKTEGDEIVSEITDTSGNPIEIWVQWQRVDDFLDSTSQSRHYIINRVSGEIQFGNGVQGMIPPIGRNNIRITYQSGGGKDGNVEASEIQSLKTSIPFVDSVNNPVPASGGSDTEELERVLERGPQLLRNRGRAVTFEDYEWLAREASSDIVRVKCLPNFNNEGDFEPGWITVVIVPESVEEKPVPSPLLLRKVEEYLSKRCSNVVVAAKRLQVTGPDYIKVSVSADIYPVSIDLASIAEENALEELKEFLHPLTGGTDRTGWEFGRAVCISDIYSLLEKIEEIDHVERVFMKLEGDSQTMTITSESSVNVFIPPYALIYSGEHSLNPLIFR